MKNIIVLLLAWSILSSSVPSQNSSKNLEPVHSSPVMEVRITEASSNQLLIFVQVEKTFLKGKGLMTNTSKVKIPILKKYFNEHLKIYTNGKFNPLKLKSISQNKNLVNIQFKINPKLPYQSLKVFSDCLMNMGHHDRMPVRINIKNIKKTYRINNENQSVQINKL